MMMVAMRDVYDALGGKSRLEDITLGVRLTNPLFRLVRQDYHAQFALYSVPDDVAQAFDCSSRTTIPDSLHLEARDFCVLGKSELGARPLGSVVCRDNRCPRDRVPSD